MKRVLPLLLAALMLAGCAGSPAAYGSAQALNAVTLPKAPAEEDYEARAALRQAVSDAQYRAALDFATRSAPIVLEEGKADANRLYSPLSLYFALAMLAETAGGNTYTQIAAALGIGPGYEPLEGTADLYRLLYAEDAYTRLHPANSAWIQAGENGPSFKDAALDALAQKHYAEVFAVDFENKEAGEAIGAWISQKTNGLLGDDFQVPAQTLMMLVNTVYFKSEWTDRFYAENTAPATFHNADGSESQWDFMHKTTLQAFGYTEQYTAASLGLKGGSVRFILPREGVTPQDILQGEGWAEALAGGTEGGYGSVTWQVPKLDYNENIPLNEAVKALGVTDAFDLEKADFSPLSENPLFISSIHQQSAVSMDENGVEAASYTDIAYAGAAMPTDQAEMILDRPYLFIIYAENLPLFVGIVNAL